MKLRFNLGAVVELSLLPDPSNQKITGKVISVTPEEIEVCPQLRVYRNINGFGQLDTTVSADAKYTLHIRRALITCWRYVKVTSLQDNGFVSEKSLATSFLSELPLEDYTLNHYDSTGFCKGTGKYCGDVIEFGRSIIITRKDSDN